MLEEIEYLEAQAAGLGGRLLDEVRRGETTLARHPEAGSPIAPEIRKWVLRRFRYSLIYTLEDGMPLILAVAHTSRRPGYWAARLQK